MSDETLKFNYYQIIDLPDRTTTPGMYDLRSHPLRYGMTTDVLSSKSVIDVATNNGFWAFHAKTSGATRVVGIDVDRFEDYDWGFGGCPQAYQGKMNNRLAFDHLNEKYRFGVERRTQSIYDLSPEKNGTFDISICYGLIYHLRHPLLSLDRLRAVTSGFTIIQTNIFYFADDMPANLFLHDDVWNGVTNWTGANVSCMAHWMKDAGFTTVFVDKMKLLPPKKRWQSRIFVGCIEPWAVAHFSKVPALEQFDAVRFADARSQIKTLL